MDRHLPDDLRLQLEAELEALEGLEDAGGLAPDYLRFCGEVARFQARARDAIRSALGTPAPAADEAGADPPVRRLSPEAIGLDPILLRDLLEELRALARPPASADDQLQRLAAASAADAELLTELVSAAMAGGGAAARLERTGARIGVSLPALAFVARMLALPFVAEARHRLGDLPEVDARELGVQEAVRCPTCASRAALAVLDPADGRRRLLCSLCGETWIAPRLMCGFCGAQTGLATLRESAADPRWLETCDSCRHYIKTIDLRRLPEPYALLPIAEQAATLHLDVMAEEAGYFQPAW